MGRPVRSKYTDEEKAERARLSAMRRYYNNIEKDRERTIIEYHATNHCSKSYHFLNICVIVNFLLNKYQHSHINRDYVIYTPPDSPKS